MWSCTSCQDTSSVILRNMRAKTFKFGRRCLNLHENTSRETGIKYVQQLYSAGPDTAYRYSVFLAGLNLSQIWAPFGQREPSAGPGSELVQPTTQFAFARTNFGGLRLLFFKCCSWFCMHVLAPKHDKTSDHLWMSQNTLSWLCFFKKMVVMSSFIWSLDAIIPPAAYDVSKSLV